MFIVTLDGLLYNTLGYSDFYLFNINENVAELLCP